MEREPSLLDHEGARQIDIPRSREEYVDFVLEQSFPGSDPAPFYCGGFARKYFAGDD